MFSDETKSNEKKKRLRMELYFIYEPFFFGGGNVAVAVIIFFWLNTKVVVMPMNDSQQQRFCVVPLVAIEDKQTTTSPNRNIFQMFPIAKGNEKLQIKKIVFFFFTSIAAASVAVVVIGFDFIMI